MRTLIPRRRFLQSAAASALVAVPAARTAWGANPVLESPVFGFIGAGIRHKQLVPGVLRHGLAAAICDVDQNQLSKAAASLDAKKRELGLSTPAPSLASDYRDLLDRRDIDAVVIATPDHWHVKIAVEALQAGKHVYCEKPLTLTVEEGQLIREALRHADGVLQVGTNQRSGRMFQVAAALARSGRIGRMKRVTCAIGGAPKSDGLPVCQPPAGLNWDAWLGPAPATSYRAGDSVEQEGYGAGFPHSRCHVHFRWWYEYGGGKITDWGAHHVDIALWAVGGSAASDGPFRVDPLRVVHPVAYRDGYALVDDRFNVATEFHLRVTFADGMELDIVDQSEEFDTGNAVVFEGAEGRFLVNRGKLVGQPVEDLAANPLPADAAPRLYAPLAEFDERSIAPEDFEVTNARHMENFVSCLKSGGTPISDAESHHRHLSVCHVANIALRLGRALTFDPVAERFVGDEQANRFIRRERRPAYEIHV